MHRHAESGRRLRADMRMCGSPPVSRAARCQSRGRGRSANGSWCGRCGGRAQHHIHPEGEGEGLGVGGCPEVPRQGGQDLVVVLGGDPVRPLHGLVRARYGVLPGGGEDEARLAQHPKRRAVALGGHPARDIADPWERKSGPVGSRPKPGIGSGPEELGSGRRSAASAACDAAEQGLATAGPSPWECGASSRTLRGSRTRPTGGRPGAARSLERGAFDTSYRDGRSGLGRGPSLYGAMLVPHRFHAGTAPVPEWYRTGSVLVLCRSTSPALVLHWHCTGSQLALYWCLYWYCTGTTPALHCTGTTQVMHEYYTGTTLALHAYCTPWV